MLQDKTFPSICHDFLHPLPDVLSSLAFKLGYQLDAAGHVLQARSQVALAELRRLAKQASAVEIEEIKNFDCGCGSEDAILQTTE